MTTQYGENTKVWKYKVVEKKQNSENFQWWKYKTIRIFNCEIPNW